MICETLHINSAVRDWACIQCLLMQEMPQTQAPEDGLVGDRCREPRLLEILGECPEGPPGMTGSPGLEESWPASKRSCCILVIISFCSKILEKTKSWPTGAIFDPFSFCLRH